MTEPTIQTHDIFMKAAIRYYERIGAPPPTEMVHWVRPLDKRRDELADLCEKILA